MPIALIIVSWLAARMIGKWFFALPALGILVGCGVSGFPESDDSSQDQVVLPLSPGIQIAMQVSGGIAGLNERTQIGDDWLLSVDTRNASFSRRLDGDEQMTLRKILERFGTLNHRASDPPGPSVADAIETTVVARGWGDGVATSNDVEMLRALLLNLREHEGRSGEASE